MEKQGEKIKKSEESEKVKKSEKSEKGGDLKC